MTPTLAPLDTVRRAAIRDRLTRTGRAQVDGVFTPSDARTLYEAATAAEYNVVTRRETGHVDLPAAWLASLTPDQKRGLGQAVQTSAQTDFQYLYDNHPIYDLVQTGQAAPIWRDLLAFLNGAAFLDLMRDLTGEGRIALADAQLTRYRAGHFLTEHDDHADGKNRFFAYVLNLTPIWRIEWGGLLAFHGTDGNVAEAFTPRFNTLNLLKVPSPHSVTQVALSAAADRISVTGWLRGA
ncbi:2OG-Fe(II) oxygenase family protein [Brevundimonas sp. SORGH_AS_0993]|uniref:2OG-Fe(II) oxygenase n=1 Tax=Brevundimonas sp. SORGH_AS_0993 TaxID=3041794 RepID=UPI0027804E90|nr:2OG-Fe(II) oxygenase family protein [Brevundimonas sp. SORGH_AS_0993]MDQ1153945.1 SM-20-related protein [Brevundimonas sp. SORGH_AS_0993]